MADEESSSDSSPSRSSLQNWVPNPSLSICILSTVFPTTTATTKRAMSAGLLRRSRTATEIAAKRKGPRPKSQAERSTTRNSMLGRQQDRSGFSRSLSDNPDFHTRAEPIRGKQTPAVLEAELVFTDVLRREVAPVAIEMSLQKRQRRFSRCLECFQGTGSSHDLSRLKLHFFATFLTKSSAPRSWTS